MTYTLDKVIKLQGRVIEKRTSIEILKQICVSDGFAFGTDMDLTLFMPTDLTDGLYDPERAKIAIAGADICPRYVGELTLDDFPTFPAVMRCKDWSSVEVPAIDLERQLSRVAFAISTEETRFYLNGVAIDQKAGCLVATDGHRLSASYADWCKKSPAFKQSGLPILPTKLVKLVRVLLKEAKPETVKLWIDEKELKVILRVGSFVVWSKLIDACFPDWQRVLPRNTKKVLSTKAKTLQAIVKPASSGCKDSDERHVRVEIGETEACFSSRVAGTDERASLGSIAAKNKYGGLFGVNAAYVTDVCKFFPKSDLELKMVMAKGRDVGENQVSAVDPMILKPAGEKDFTLLMPVRL